MPVGGGESCGLLSVFAAEHARTGRLIVARTLARVSRGASSPARLPAANRIAAARRACGQPQARTTFDARRQSAVLAANKYVFTTDSRHDLPIYCSGKLYSGEFERDCLLEIDT